MSTMVARDSEAIVLSEKAAEVVRSILERQGKVGYGLRVFVAGGGCSGLQYGMALEEAPEEEDLIFEHYGLRVFVDPLSYRYLKGSFIDYVETLMGGGFKIDNPNAVASCGCGQSFRTAEAGEGGCCG